MTATVADIASASGGKVVQGDPLAPVRGATLDSRAAGGGGAFFAVRGSRTDGHRFVGSARRSGAAAAVIEKGTPRALGVPSSFPLVRVSSSTRALQAAGSAHRRRHRIPVIGITGSNGKTSVKDIVAALFAGALGEGAVLATRGNLNNHLGVPLTLLALGSRHRVAVLELAMNHPGEMTRLAAFAAPTSGAILNAGRAHLAAFGSVAAVARAKAELIESLPAGGWAVLNADDANVWARRGATRARVAGFGVDAGEFRAEGPVMDGRGRTRFTLRLPDGRHAVRTVLPGAHGARNAVAAAAIAWTHGIDGRAIARGLAAFRPRARMRLEWRRLRGGARGIADCYNANPDSVSAAFAYIRGLGARRPVLVLGDMRELGTRGPAAHREVGREAASLDPELVVGVGQLARGIADGALGAGARRVEWFREPAAAEAAIADALVPGRVALFKASRLVRLERLVELLAAGKEGGHAV